MDYKYAFASIQFHQESDQQSFHARFQVAFIERDLKVCTPDATNFSMRWLKRAFCRKRKSSRELLHQFALNRILIAQKWDQECLTSPNREVTSTPVWNARLD